jgi:hypothetical protein
MNVKRFNPETKLLAAPKGGAAGKFLPDRRRDSGLAVFYTAEEIHIRAETMTPLLRKILDYEPSPHWGINE